MKPETPKPRRRSSGTLLTLFIVSVSLNAGLISGWVKIGDPAQYRAHLSAASKIGYDAGERAGMDSMILSVQDLK